MNDPQIIFEKLLEIDESLGNNREIVMKIIEKLLKEKPDTGFDDAFAAVLKQKLEEELTASGAQKASEAVGTEVSEMTSGEALAESTSQGVLSQSLAASQMSLQKSPFALLLKNFFTSRKFAYLASVVVASLAIFAGWYVYDLRTGAPEVLAGNWSFEYRKIPFDVPSIDLTLSRDIDAKTVTPASVKIYPVVTMTPEVKNGNTISLKLAEKLKIGERYTLELSPEIASIYGVKLGKSKYFEFEAVAWAKVTRVIPSGSGAVQNKPILAFFSVPIIPTASLAKKDEIACPFTFDPAIEGKCRWLSSSVVEFDPKNALKASTLYKVRVSSGEGFLYPLSEEYLGEFATERLTYLTGSITSDLAKDVGSNPEYMDLTNLSFTPSKGIPLRFSSSVRRDELEKHVKIFDISAGSGAEKPVSFVLSGATGKDVSAYYRALPADTSFEFGKKYRVQIAAGLPSAEGNMALESSTENTINSSELVTSISVYREKLSETGAVTDSSYIQQNGYGTGAVYYISPKEANITLNFSEPANIPKGSIYLESNGSQIACELTYGKTSIVKPSGETVQEDYKNEVHCRPMTELVPNTKYQIVVTKAVSAGLRENKTFQAITPKILTIDPQVKLVSDMELCVYSSEPLSYSASGVITNPTTPVRDITKDGDSFWNPHKDMYESVLRCPVRENLVANVIGVRLAPKVKYNIAFSPEQKDIYGDSLTNSMSAEVTGVDILPRDKYVFSPLSRQTNVIPANVPFINAFQTVNADTIKITVCELDLEGYSKFPTSQYTDTEYIPNCKKTYEKDLPVKNLAWNTSFSKFDIEKEVVGGPLTSPYVLVTSTVMGEYRSLYGKHDPDRETRQLFIRSNLSMTLEAGKESVLFVTDFDGKTAKEGMTFDFLNISDAGVTKIEGITSRWDANKKMYYLSDKNNTFNRINFIVGHAPDGETGVISFVNDQLGNYDFGYNGGADSYVNDYVYVYSDRPIYKAGDQVFFKGLLRTFNPRGYTKSSAGIVSARILDEAWTLLKEVQLTVDKNANFSGDIAIPNEAKSGKYHFEIFVAKNKGDLVNGQFVYNDAYFYVEAYKKPVFRAGVGIDKKDSELGDSVNVQISPTYYFGGKVVSTKYDYAVSTQSYFFDAKDYSDYQFGVGYNRFDCLYWGQCSFHDSLSPVTTGEIGANGNANFSFVLPNKEKDSNGEDLAEKIFTFNVDVTDPDTGKTISDSASTVLHTTDGYAGIKLPYWINPKSPIAWDGILLTTDATPKSGDIKVEYTKQEWKNVRKQGVDGAYYNDYSLEKTLEASETLSAGKDGKFKISYSPKSSGEYEVRVSYAGKNGKTYTSASTIYVASDDYVSWGGNNNSVTEMVVEKNLLKVGETATLTVKSPVKNGLMFVSIEKDSEILNSYTTPIGSYSPRIDIPITEAYLPNIYVKVFLIGKDEGMQLPVYKRALSVLKISTESKKLKVDVKADKQSYLPGSPATIAVFVTDTLGHPVKHANGSLAVVDESVLALLGNPKKNPFAFFYDMKRYLGTSTFASLTNLIEKLEVKNIGNGEKGGAGDAVKGGDAKKKRGVFKDTASWQANFETDENGRAIIKIGALPDNLTTWNIEAIVSTSDDNKIGIGETSVSANKAVMILENLPRFFRSGDTVKLAPVVFNHTGKESDFTVSLASESLAVKSGTQTIHLKDGESRAVSFEVVPKQIAPNSSAEGVKLDISAKSETTGEVDSLEYTLPLENSTLYETTTTVGSTKDNSYDEKLDLSDIAGRNGTLSVRFAATPLAFLADGMDYLSNYPYGCAEQKTSAIAPNIAMKKLFDSANLPFDLDKKMVRKYQDREDGYKDIPLSEVLKDYLVSIASHTKPNGGIAYWKESEYSDFAISSMVLKTVAELDSIGIKADAKWKSALAAYLRDRFYKNQYEPCFSNNKADCAYSEEERLDAIAALLGAGAQISEVEKMRSLIDESKLSPLASLAYFKLLSDERVKSKDEALNKTLAEALTKRSTEMLSKYLVYNPRGAFLSMSGSVSRIEATSILLEALYKNPGVIAGTEEISENILRFLASEKQSNGGFGSSRDTAAVMRAVTTYLVNSKDIQNTNMVAKAILNSQPILENPIAKNELFASFVKQVPLSEVAKDSTLHFEKVGEGKLSYEIALRYAMPASKASARDEGFLVETSYYDYAKYREILAKKQAEWHDYELGNRTYESLSYPLDPASYLTPIDSFTVGKLVYVRTQILTPETRDKVAMSAKIPAGTELVNTELSTETKATTDEKPFEKEDLRDDEYFAYKETMEPGQYIASYVLRPTHTGTYTVPSTSVYEFDHEEVFGRSSGGEITTQK